MGFTSGRWACCALSMWFFTDDAARSTSLPWEALALCTELASSRSADSQPALSQRPLAPSAAPTRHTMGAAASTKGYTKDQLVAFAFHDSNNVVRAADEAKEMDKIVTVMYLD